MPGTLPMRRRRRLAPPPCASRFCALISIAIVVLLEKLFYEKRTDGFLGIDAQYRLGDQPGHRELPYLLAGARLVAKRNGVGHHQLVDVRAGDALDRFAREDRV